MKRFGSSSFHKDYEAVTNNNGAGGANASGDRAPSGQETYDIPTGKLKHKFPIYTHVHENCFLSGATTDNLPSGVLYRVRASYKYQAEDVDELQFEVGEIINVIPYEDPEEQEEGWLMGTKESTGQKGMFPANFTRPV